MEYAIRNKRNGEEKGKQFLKSFQLDLFEGKSKHEAKEWINRLGLSGDSKGAKSNAEMEMLGMEPSIHSLGAQQ